MSCQGEISLGAIPAALDAASAASNSGPLTLRRAWAAVANFAAANERALTKLALSAHGSGRGSSTEDTRAKAGVAIGAEQIIGPWIADDNLFPGPHNGRSSNRLKNYR